MTSYSSNYSGGNAFRSSEGHSRTTSEILTVVALQMLFERTSADAELLNMASLMSITSEPPKSVFR